jgi:hypothetical protein
VEHMSRGGCHADTLEAVLALTVEVYGLFNGLCFLSLLRWGGDPSLERVAITKGSLSTGMSHRHEHWSRSAREDVPVRLGNSADDGRTCRLRLGQAPVAPRSRSPSTFRRVAKRARNLGSGCIASAGLRITSTPNHDARSLSRQTTHAPRTQGHCRQGRGTSLAFRWRAL